MEMEVFHLGDLHNHLLSHLSKRALRPLWTVQHVVGKTKESFIFSSSICHFQVLGGILLVVQPPIIFGGQSSYSNEVRVDSGSQTVAYAQLSRNFGNWLFFTSIMSRGGFLVLNLWPLLFGVIKATDFFWQISSLQEWLWFSNRDFCPDAHHGWRSCGKQGFCWHQLHYCKVCIRSVTPLFAPAFTLDHNWSNLSTILCWDKSTGPKQKYIQN